MVSTSIIDAFTSQEFQFDLAWSASTFVDATHDLAMRVGSMLILYSLTRSGTYRAGQTNIAPEVRRYSIRRPNLRTSSRPLHPNRKSSQTVEPRLERCAVGPKFRDEHSLYARGKDVAVIMLVRRVAIWHCRPSVWCECQFECVQAEGLEMLVQVLPLKKIVQ
jgi:hypothetical protein